MPILPDDFWQARKVFRHIREAAYSRLASGDLVFHGVLAKVAAMRSHELRFDSGFGLGASANYFVAGVGPSGVGKTTSAGVVGDLTPVPAWLQSRGGDLADQPFRDGLPLGSGE